MSVSRHNEAQIIEKEVTDGETGSLSEKNYFERTINNLQGMHSL